MPVSELFYVGVKVILEDSKGRVLLLYVGRPEKRAIKEPYWDIPGGRIEEGRSVIETLNRELEEETGIKQLNGTFLLTATISNHVSELEGRTIRLILIVYKAVAPENSTIKLSNEHSAYEWVGKKEAAKRLAHKYSAEFIKLL